MRKNEDSDVTDSDREDQNNQVKKKRIKKTIEVDALLAAYKAFSPELPPESSTSENEEKIQEEDLVIIYFQVI